MRQLWQYTHPQSLTYAFMQDPLLSEEVLLGWDHVARLKTALDQRPDDLVAFPVPKGPKARCVHAGHRRASAIPKNAPNPAGAKALIQHLLTISAQAQMLSLPDSSRSSAAACPSSISPGLLAEAAAVRRQQKAKDAVQALLPIGIGAEGGKLQQDLPRHVHADRAQRRGHPDRPQRAGRSAAGQIFDEDGRALLGARPAERKGSLPREVAATTRRHRARDDDRPGDRPLTRRRRRWEGSALLADPPHRRLPRPLLRVADDPGLRARPAETRPATGPSPRSTRWSNDAGLRRGDELHVPPDPRDRARSSSCSRSGWRSS